MDQTLLYLINQKWTNPALDWFMAAISNAAIWKPFVAVLLLVVLIFGGFKTRACVICLLLTLLVTNQITRVLKPLIGRGRPKQVQTVRIVVEQHTDPAFLTLFKKTEVRLSDQSDRNRSGPSFPSGHVSDNTVIATCLTLFYRKRGALYWIVMAAVAYSRVYLGAHWPSDVLATWFLALGETLLIMALLELLWRWGGSRWLPRIYERHSSLIVGPVSNLPSSVFARRGERHK